MLMAMFCIPSDSGRIPTELGQKSPSGKNEKFEAPECDKNILVVPVHPGWYLSTTFLHVEKAILTLSKLK
jgi:hypothetical protein